MYIEDIAVSRLQILSSSFHQISVLACTDNRFGTSGKPRLNSLKLFFLLSSDQVYCASGSMMGHLYWLASALMLVDEMVHQLTLQRSCSASSVGSLSINFKQI